MAYNEKYNITPRSTKRTLKEKKGEIKTRAPSKDDLKGMSKDEIRLVVKDLEAEMKEAADNLDLYLNIHDKRCEAKIKKLFEFSDIKLQQNVAKVREYIFDDSIDSEDFNL